MDEIFEKIGKLDAKKEAILNDLQPVLKALQENEDDQEAIKKYESLSIKLHKVNVELEKAYDAFAKFTHLDEIRSYVEEAKDKLGIIERVLDANQ